MNDEDCIKQMYEWANDYCKSVNNFAKFNGFKDLGKKTLGHTLYITEQGRTRIVIELSTRLDKDWKIRAVLWHEFCHAWAYCDTGKSQSHGWEWDKRFWKKPMMAVLDWFMVA